MKRSATEMVAESAAQEAAKYDTNVSTPATPEPLVSPTLTQAEASAGWPEGSRGATESIEQYEAAKQALNKADAAELFVLYERAVRDRKQLQFLFSMTAKHYAGSKDEPRFKPDEQAAPSNDVVSAMERVALAAIDLAKSIATRHE